MQNMEGSGGPILGEGMGKLKLYPSYLQNGRSGGLEICCAVGSLRALKNKILASGPPVKGGPEKNNFDFKKFFRN